MVYILPICFPLNMSKCNSENAVWIVSDNLDLIVYICRVLDLNYYQSYFQSMNIELVSMQLMQIRNSKCLTESYISACKAVCLYQDC